MDIVVLSLLDHFAAKYNFCVKTTGFTTREKVFILEQAVRVGNCRESAIFQNELDLSYLQKSVSDIRAVGRWKHEWTWTYACVGPWTGSGITREGVGNRFGNQNSLLITLCG